MNDVGLRVLSVLGFVSMIGVAWVFSSDRRRFPWRVVLSGIALQFILAVLLLKTPVGSAFFNAMRAVVGAFLGYTEEGTRFVFGGLVETGFSIFVNVLPIIIFSGCFFSVLYHLGVLQRVVDVLSAVLTRTMRISGAESLCAAANLFVGMTEAALVVKPYLPRMTRSELFALMTLGMATVAGSVLLAYVGMLGGADYAGHLATASLLSVPAGLLIAKIMVPETGTPETTERGHAGVERTAVNVIDAAAAGALAGLRLASYVGALLIAFVAMIALLNGLLGALGELFGVQLTLQGLLGFALAPVAALMGVPWEDARQVGALLGVKTILNEFLAYQQLAELISTGAISKRAAVIASYGLCGFANFGSLAILLGGIGGLAPERRPEVAQLGLRCILAGSLATFMTGCMAGLLL
ncbi:MAG: nucleoside transporter C-terminal domain-containing protein [Myxococcota bacterium]|nr:nucleoside transporter C-terminal domain-containing protein [Myxococcota bacterium]MDP6243488.1 nucleoside transporter C-terminal domain-containing protein [Myxococcota bacterium]MDP7076525.1 nucleoside transporter C-terminal domain-containing protein [Myxococcota bacterium]MDP7299084.1 nucleoside transporter C-terminal domain-containing protein [Myxococcota bacterium]MDP7431261.1 nucleoside transporter C-terminal domain-containing protein [Myxococcota bacterium]